MKMLRSVTDRLELGVVEAPDGGNSIDLHVAETLATLSIAISLKRIADALEPNHVTEGGALNVRDLLSELVERGRG